MTPKHQLSGVSLSVKHLVRSVVSDCHTTCQCQFITLQVTSQCIVSHQVIVTADHTAGHCQIITQQVPVMCQFVTVAITWCQAGSLVDWLSYNRSVLSCGKCRRHTVDLCVVFVDRDGRVCLHPLSQSLL